MPDSIKFTLDHNATAIVARLEAFPRRMGVAIVRTLDEQNELTIGSITENRLTGSGPFPVEEHRLGVVSNVLRRSLRKSKATINGNTIESAIGTNVSYAGAHEFGFHGTVTVKAHRSTNQHVDLIQVGGDRILPRWQSVGEKGRKKKVASGLVTVKPHQKILNIPERAPIRTGINERVPNYQTALSGAIVNAWGGDS
jgi:hypothetical protein